MINPATGKDFTLAELVARVAELEAQANKTNAIYFRVSENKGTVGVYGLGKMPVSCYIGQWDRILTDENVKALKAFISSPEVTKLSPAKTDSDETKATKATLRKASISKLNGAAIVAHPTEASKKLYGTA